MSEITEIYIDPFSVCAVPIKICCADDILGQATGFFFEKANRLFLISNWHVFSGREPRNGQPKDQETFRIPDSLELAFHPVNNLRAVVQIRVPLKSSEGLSRWIQHKNHGQKIDVAAIEINMTDIIDEIKYKNCRPLTINGAPQVKTMRVAVGSDVFVLGFPLGIMKTGLLPVWKRGSVATELEIDVNDLPSFIIDTATREGMSGSPVIARSVGGYTEEDGGSLMAPGAFNRFLGVYSGRYVGGIDEAHLGIVWKSVVIEQIIDNPSPGDFETN